MYAIIEAFVLAFINKYGMMAGRFSSETQSE